VAHTIASNLLHAWGNWIHKAPDAAATSHGNTGRKHRTRPVTLGKKDIQKTAVAMENGTASGKNEKKTAKASNRRPMSLQKNGACASIRLVFRRLRARAAEALKKANNQQCRPRRGRLRQEHSSTDAASRGKRSTARRKDATEDRRRAAGGERVL